jgi:hypothetical protein
MLSTSPQTAKSGNNDISLLGSCKLEKLVKSESERACESRNEFYPFNVSCRLRYSFLTTDWLYYLIMSIYSVESDIYCVISCPRAILIVSFYQ